MRQTITAAILSGVIALAATGCVLLPQPRSAFEDRDDNGETLANQDDESAESDISTPQPAPTSSPAAPRRESVVPPADDDRLRLPEMRTLPTERELRRTPGDTDEDADESTGGVSARPPADADVEPTEPAAQD